MKNSNEVGACVCSLCDRTGTNLTRKAIVYINNLFHQSIRDAAVYKKLKQNKKTTIIMNDIAVYTVCDLKQSQKSNQGFFMHWKLVGYLYVLC